MIARLVTLLPQPDSPTRPRRLALVQLEVTPLTAWIVPSWVRKRTTRSSTEQREPAAAGRRHRLHPRIERLAQAVAEQVEPDRADRRSRAPGKNSSHGAWRRNFGRVGQHRAPLRGPRIGRAEAQEPEAGDVDDRGRQRERGRDDERRQRVRQQVPEQQPRPDAPDRPRGRHVVRFAQRRAGCRAGCGRRSATLTTATANMICGKPAAEPGDDPDGEQDARDRQHDVDDAHQDRVHPPADAAGERRRSPRR